MQARQGPPSKNSLIRHLFSNLQRPQLAQQPLLAPQVGRLRLHLQGKALQQHLLLPAQLQQALQRPGLLHLTGRVVLHRHLPYTPCSSRCPSCPPSRSSSRLGSGALVPPLRSVFRQGLCQHWVAALGAACKLQRQELWLHLQVLLLVQHCQGLLLHRQQQHQQQRLGARLLGARSSGRQA